MVLLMYLDCGHQFIIKSKKYGFVEIATKELPKIVVCPKCKKKVQVVGEDICVSDIIIRT